VTDFHDLNRYRRIAQVAQQALADYASTAPADPAAVRAYLDEMR
jgi:hypothetical protein